MSDSEINVVAVAVGRAAGKVTLSLETWVKCGADLGGGGKMQMLIPMKVRTLPVRTPYPHTYTYSLLGATGYGSN